MKDAGFMVERYLIRKSLMKPLQEYQEMKKLKTADQKRFCDKVTFGGVSDLTWCTPADNFSMSST